jgi:hypothetical protein
LAIKNISGFSSLFFRCPLLSLLWVSAPAQAQTVLTGTVRNAAGQPLEGILLEAETKAQPPATAFVISATDGRFALTLAATPASDSVYLHARALGYAEQLLRLPNQSKNKLSPESP